MAHHLQDLVWRIVPVENANFLSLSPEHKELEAILARDPSSGLKVIEDAQRRARAALPEVMRVRIGDRVLIVAMGRLAAQKLHDVISEGVRLLLRQHRDLPLFVAFPIVSGESGDRSRLERIHYLVHEFPDRVYCTEGRIEYYDTLMCAADYNAMTSLYEPHGGAFEGSVVPIVRLIDGLARQVNALEPTGRGVPLNALWHDPWELPSGLGFREPTTPTEVDDLQALLTGSFAPDNLTFRAMVSAFAEVLTTAVSIRRDRPEVYARLVQGALRAQMERDWLIQLGGILALVEEARLRRPL